ncbi:MAG: MerR family transcriptional regulator [Flavobacteriaceae bacterium]|nr:MerR family transcriptional regulator [Flavobacteriaceae bacterium]
MSIKTTFSIRDLEHLSGIKAHTIRIWERRYHLFEPIRSETNIRSYDQKSLQKLLNVALLLDNGFKISKIAELPENDLYKITRELQINSDQPAQAMDNLKLSMLNFDRALFDQTYHQLLEKSSFRNVFLKTFVPFLEEIGMLWLTKTITPVHEHFITNLIRQKVLIQTEKAQQLPILHEQTFALFLPINEIHELGLMYLHYELLVKGYHSIYLGQSVPMENLKDLQDIFDRVTFIGYFTVEPATEFLPDYLQEFSEKIIKPVK